MVRQVLSNTVEDDDRVVDAEADHRKQCSNKQRIDLHVEEQAENGKDAEDDEDIMQHGDQCRTAVENGVLRVAERIGHVHQNADRGKGDRQDGSIADLRGYSPANAGILKLGERANLAIRVAS